MRKFLIAAVAAAALLTVAMGGYWLGRSRDIAAAEAAPAVSTTPQGGAAAAANRTPLYYQNPDGKPDYSPVPKKTADGRDYIPVYQDAPRVVASLTPQPPAANGPQGQGRILYYRNPMGLPDTSPVPKKDAMGMAYVPVYENEAPSNTGIVQVSPGRVQMLGVRTAVVESRPALVRTVMADGTVQVDERDQSVVTTKAAGWIERLDVAATGQPVRRGQTLFEFYSPDLDAAEQEFLIATQLDSGDHSESMHLEHQSIIDAALERLAALDVPEEEIGHLRRTGEVTRLIAMPAPANGIVLEKPAIEGMRVEPGMPLYKIADLSTVWLIANVQEQDLGTLRIGDPVRAAFVAYPGRSFSGRVNFIYPEMAAETRTGRVRIVLPNPGLVLRTAMYATVQIDVPAARAGGPMLVVPDSAIIDSGTQQVVLVDRGEGTFEPRTVKVGQRGNGDTQILEGLKEGERVVTGANFLIDAESNLKSALADFAAAQPPAAAATAARTPGSAPVPAQPRGAPAMPPAGKQP